MDKELKELFGSKKKYEKFAVDILTSFIETAIIHKKISFEDFKNKPLNETKEIFLQTLKACTNDDDELNSTIIYTEDIVKEANILKNKKKYRLALILYATSIEHHLNEIIQKALINKNFKQKEIESVMRLDIEAKRTWLFPLLGLPRLSDNCSKNIKEISDKRNEFVHYKWKGLFEKEQEHDDEKYEQLCIKANQTIKLLKSYKTKNFITRSKIKKILKTKF